MKTFSEITNIRIRVYDFKKKAMIYANDYFSYIDLYNYMITKVFNVDISYPMLCTGFKLNNSEQFIYESDYIDSYQNDYIPTEVYWDEVLGAWATQNYHSTLALCDSMQKDIKILGNKFENPEYKEK